MYGVMAAARACVFMGWVLGPVRSKAIRFGPVEERKREVLVLMIAVGGGGQETKLFCCTEGCRCSR